MVKQIEWTPITNPYVSIEDGHITKGTLGVFEFTIQQDGYKTQGLTSYCAYSNNKNILNNIFSDNIDSLKRFCQKRIETVLNDCIKK